MGKEMGLGLEVEVEVDAPSDPLSTGFMSSTALLWRWLYKVPL